jgi:poly(A) polymerase
MHADFLTDPALARVWDALPDARVVGGAVRDALAGRSVADLDLAVPRPPEAVMQALRRAGVKVVATGLAHGTVTAVVDGRGFEVTTLRHDVKTDGRHAVVAFTADWKEDAARRDFTINAMSMARDGEVFDYFDGRGDLADGRVHFVGDPATRIAEDYLRILRFFRFYARFGRVPPGAATLDALKAGIPGLGQLSVERVWNELRRILAAPDPSDAVALMERLGIWTAVVPEAACVSGLAGLPADPILRLAAMLPRDGACVARARRSNINAHSTAIDSASPSSPGASGSRVAAGSSIGGPDKSGHDGDGRHVGEGRYVEEGRPDYEGRHVGEGSPDIEGGVTEVAGRAAALALALGIRLKMSNGDRDRLVRLMATPPATGSDDDLRRLLADYRPADVLDRTWLDGDPAVRQRLAGMKHPVFPLIGRDVLALGVPAGPVVGALLRDTRQWWMDGGCLAGRRACLAELARIAKLPNMEGRGE